MFQALMKTMKAKKMLPQISDTERMALEAGTVWVDGEFFNGSPDFRRMMTSPTRRFPPRSRPSSTGR